MDKNEISEALKHFNICTELLYYAEEIALTRVEPDSTYENVYSWLEEENEFTFVFSFTPTCECCDVDFYNVNVSLEELIQYMNNISEEVH